MRKGLEFAPRYPITAEGAGGRQVENKMENCLSVGHNHYTPHTHTHTYTHTHTHLEP